MHVLKNPEYISWELLEFYSHSSEENRLEFGIGPFEFQRVKNLINKYLKPNTSTILDIGGGTGKYASWLSEQGYDVHLIDPVPHHLELAQKRAKKDGVHFTVELGYAQALNFTDRSVDLVILHGPLYHLQEKEERLRAISEARRVVKPGGIVLGFAINYTASTLVGLLNGLIYDSGFANICKEELRFGTHSSHEGFPWLLADAYYHKPSQLRAEFNHKEFSHLTIHAVEGVIWMAKDFMSSLHLPKKMRQLDELLALTDRDPELLALSPHMMIAAEKVDSDSFMRSPFHSESN